MILSVGPVGSAASRAIRRRKRITESGNQLPLVLGRRHGQEETGAALRQRCGFPSGEYKRTGLYGMFFSREGPIWKWNTYLWCSSSWAGSSTETEGHNQLVWICVLCGPGT